MGGVKENEPTGQSVSRLGGLALDPIQTAFAQISFGPSSEVSGFIFQTDHVLVHDMDDAGDFDVLVAEGGAVLRYACCGGRMMALARSSTDTSGLGTNWDEVAFGW
ncbi:MAG: hypothetical protein ACQKBU_10875 [Verrucomicrobiales bacterium]